MIAGTHPTIPIIHENVAKNPADVAAPKLLKLNFLESRKYIIKTNPSAGKYH